MKRIIIALALLLGSAAAHAQTIVEAPEAPFGFEPLEMFNFPAKEFSIRKYGAKEGNVAATTEAFRKAMAACNKAGGGKVVVPAGEWTTGPIHFRSNCCLYLSEGATVIFEDDPSLYLPAVRTTWEGSECMNYSPLIYAYECENVGIAGPGTIAPEMEFWRTWFSRPPAHIEATRMLYAMCSTGIPIEQRDMTTGDANMRPHLIQFNRCRNITLDGFNIRESPFWTIHIYHSDDIWVHGLNVYAHGHNNDGIDLEMSSHALVEDCTFDQGDDAVVLKAGRNQDGWRLNKPTENIVVRNCTIVRGHCLLGIGSEMSGGVRNVYMHDCHTTDNVFRVVYIKTNHRRGGFVKDIWVENVSAANAQRVFEIDTDVMYQWREIVPTFETAITEISGIHLRDAHCTQADAIYEIRGDARKPVTDITLSGIHVDKVMKFINNAEFVRDLICTDITWNQGPSE